MHYKHFLWPSLLLFFACFQAHAWDVSLGILQAQEKVQNTKGNEAEDPLSPFLALGHVFDISESWMFSPRLGYIQNAVKSADHYSKYKIETFYILYDFNWRPSFSAKLYPRLGIGTFYKKTKGQGGTVSVPNGGGYSTAYRPGRSEASVTSTINLGVDWKFHESLGASDQGFGATLEAFVYELLEGRKRLITLSAGVFYYF